MASVVILDKVAASSHGNLESLQAAVDLDNGSVVHVGSLIAGNREVKNAVQVATATLGQEVVLVAAPELLYDTTQGMQLSKYTNKANKPCRAYHLVAGDIVTISDDGISGATVVDQFVVPANGSYKLAAAATDPGTTRLVGKVLEKWTFGVNAIPVTTIQIVKA